MPGTGLARSSRRVLGCVVVPLHADVIMTHISSI
jgi:hypothetical protein